MNEYPLTYRALRSLANREVFRYGLTHGHLGPLAFLWAVGVSAFVLFSSWVLVLLWTMLVLAIAYGMLRSYLANREVQAQLLGNALERQCLRRDLWNIEVWNSAPIRNGTGILVEAALVVGQLEREHGADQDLQHSFSDSCRLLWVLYSLAKNAEDLERSLAPIASGYRVTRGVPESDLETTVAVGAFAEEKDTFEELITEARSRVDEVLQQLEEILASLNELTILGAYAYQLAASELAGETADVSVRIKARFG